jgi:flagella basal body P-ring formation protein FlgA
MALLTEVNALEVLIKDRVSITGHFISLGDVASFDPVEDHRVARLRKIRLASSPPPGKSAVISNLQIIHGLGATLANMDNIRVKVPENLFVQRKAQVIGPQDFEGLFKEHVLRNAPWPRDRIHFEKISVPGPVRLPQGIIHEEVRNRRIGDYEGDVSLLVFLWVDGALVRKVPVTGRVSIAREVIKAARKIHVGEVIAEKDLQRVEERQLATKDDMLTSMDQIVGKRAIRSIESGQRFTRRMIEDLPLVKSGERVIIMAENERIRITAIGSALEDGAVGEQVRVINITSGKEISATVRDKGHLAVTF